MQVQTEKFEEWAIVEVMGRQSFAGRVTEQVFGGASLIRIDIPAVDGTSAFTKLIGIGSIYAITPTTQAVCENFIRYHRPVPMTMYIPPTRQLAADPDPDPNGGDEDTI